jgi:hypothetical protein
MPENQMSAPIELAEGYDPFSEDVYVPQAQPQVEVAPTVNNEQQETAQQSVETEQQVQPETQAASEQTSFDPNQFIRERFGFESVEEAEQEFKKLKEVKTPEFDFENETSRNLFAAIKEGKSDEIFQILDQQKRLEKLTNSEINANIAAEIIKTNIENKYKDLSKEEVDILFYDNYNFPPKPEQGYDETEEDYNTKVQNWQSQIEFIEKRMIIDAKVIRPELEKLKSEIKLPDVYGFDQLQAESQEELESMQQARQIYEQTLNSEFNNFNGFNVSVKDEDVEIPIAFNVAEDERFRMKETLSDFDSDNYFGERWFNEDGKPKVQQVMSDIYILENFNKILQKVANEAASQRLVAHIKKSGNITINNPTPQGQPQQNPNALMDSLADWAFRD